MKKVCVIGAGSSGITAAKALKEAGLAFDVYEKGSDIGGNWRFGNDNGLSSAYRSLHINTNREVMAYSDFPMPADLPMFPHHSQIIRYFEDYVAHFGLRDHIHFNTTVEEVSQETDGSWKVLTSKGQENYAAVMVCNGHHWNPRYPDFPGKFTGESFHSHFYKDDSLLRDKDVLVVGIGNSAVDIACEAARLHTGKVVISSRSGAYIVPNWLGSIPFDNLANPLSAKLPLFAQRWLLSAAVRLARGKQETFGVPVPKRPMLSEHPTISQDLLNLSGRGLVTFKPNIKKLQEKTVLFEDGTSQNFDLIIYSTGYKVTFPFLKHIAAFDVEDSNNIRLYKKVIHPQHKNLFFIGLCQPLGAIMPLAETQNRWVAGVLAGKFGLPSPEAMTASIAQDTAAMERRYKASPRHTLQVDFHTYKASVEKEMRRKTT